MKIVMSGSCGKMGQAIMAGIIDDELVDIVGAVDVKNEGIDISQFIGGDKRGVAVTGDLEQTIIDTKADLLLDFTNPQAVRKNIDIALRHGAHCIIGTTGLGECDMKEIDATAKAAGKVVFIAPNFALGAVLMMRFSAEAAKYFPNIEVIELHHDQKMDAPSGTAIKTLELMAENRKAVSQGAPNEFEKIKGSRGGEYQGMRVHSVRLPGFVAHQEVIFGGIGQSLIIRHDSISRDSYVPGVLAAVKEVPQREPGLIYGLENLL